MSVESRSRPLTPDELSQRAELTDKRLQQALAVARNNQTAIFILPRAYPIGALLNALTYMVQTSSDSWNAKPDYGSNTFYFEGTRGSVRFYHADHATYDTKTKRLTDYPLGTPTFLHPALDEI